MADERKFAFRKMLVKLSKELGDEDIKNLKMMCKDDIGKRDLEKIGMDARELFNSLEELGKVKINDVSYLKQLIEEACKAPANFLSIIEEYERNHLAGGVSDDHSGLARYLSHNIGKDYRMVLRTLGLTDKELDRLEDDHPRNCEEVIYKGICKCFNVGRLTSVEDVISKLESNGFRSVAHEISDYLKDS